MKNVGVALIINKNRYLITKLSSGDFTGRWAFPSGTLDRGETEFYALKQAVKDTHSIDIFPYLIIKRLVRTGPSGKTQITLIKCAISNETKTRLSNTLPDPLHVEFTPSDKLIFNYLTKGKTIRPRKRRVSAFASKAARKREPMTGTGGKRGFAAMSLEQRTMIASLGGKRAHALGKAHRWTSEEAKKAGEISGKMPRYYKYK
jgi:hypothetical protein